MDRERVCDGFCGVYTVGREALRCLAGTVVVRGWVLGDGVFEFGFEFQCVSSMGSNTICV